MPAAQFVANEILARNCHRVFVLTNRSLHGTPLVTSIVERLGNRFAGMYSECAAHSPRECVLAGSAAARAARADVLIAVGGGSVIDATKLMLGALWWNLDSLEGIDHLKSGELTTSVGTAPLLRMLAVPTTLSAAEFTDLAGITDTARGTKELFDHPFFVPAAVVLDPVATLHTPDWLLLSTGVRAVDHCVETLCSSAPTSYADAVAQGGLGLLASSLRLIKRNHSDLSARLDCQMGAWLAVSGFTSGVPVGASHGIGRILGGALSVPHGHTSCVLLPSVLKWNARDERSHGRQSEVLRALGAPLGISASEAISNLISELGQPTSLRELGLQRSDFKMIAGKSLQMLKHPSVCGNQRQIATESDILEILELAY